MIPKSKQARKIISQVRALPLRDEVWEATFQRVRTWVTPKKKAPYRPYLVMMISTDKNRIIRTHLTEDKLGAKEFFFELLSAMYKPMWFAGGKRRPTTIHLNHDEFTEELAPQLEKLNIRLLYRHSLPIIKEAIYEMEKQMNKGELMPGLLSLPRITPPLVGYLYQLAKEFYDIGPWQWLNEMHPIEIRYPVNSRPRYAIVMGSGGSVFGLAIYDTLAGLKEILSDSYNEKKESPPTFALYFDKAQAMSFDDLEAAERYKWPIAAKNAYPVFGRSQPQNTFDIPTTKDMLWAEGALAGIVTYLREHFATNLPYNQQIELELTITTLSGEKEVYLRLPVEIE